MIGIGNRRQNIRSSCTVFSLLSVLWLGGLPTLRGDTFAVATAAEFNALPPLDAGDHVILASGSYGQIDKILVSTISDEATAINSPILVTAVEPGGVQISAPSQITLKGSGIILAGLDFVASGGMLDNESKSPAWILRTAADSRHIRLSNLRFDSCNQGDNYGHWIYVEGFHHRIEYCSFEGKDEPNRNATVAFKRNRSEAGIDTPRGHLLRACYFGPRECSVSENGYETIRIGDSSSQAHDMQVTIEGNVFDRCVWRKDGQKPNDPEIISSKTKGNRIIGNTFLESFGQITLRHGDHCLVEGNFIFGGGAYRDGVIHLHPANPHQGGIRLIGQNHVVRNNYLVNLAGTGLRASLCLMAGEKAWYDGDGSGGDNGYETTDNALITNNTFLNCRELYLGYSKKGNLQPTGVRVFNNAWQSDGNSNGIVKNPDLTLAASGGNYRSHPDGKIGWKELSGMWSSEASLAISEPWQDCLIPHAESPLVDTADSASRVAKDIQGRKRPHSGQDIGCFERGLPAGGQAPLLRHQVGPLFHLGPQNTYPVPFHSR